MPGIVGCDSVSFPDNPHKVSIPLQPPFFQSFEPVLRHANPVLFQVSGAPAPQDGADHSRVKQGTDSWAPVGLSRGRRPDRSPWERGRPARIPSQLSGAASASRKGSNGAVAG